MSFATSSDWTVSEASDAPAAAAPALRFGLFAPAPLLTRGAFARLGNVFEKDRKLRHFNPLGDIAAAKAVRMIKEPKTDTRFPEEFCTRGKEQDCSQLTGMGVRSKRLLGLKNLNIYSVGLYVDPVYTVERLQKYGYLTQAGLANTSGMYQDVCRAPGLEKTIRLVVVYGGLKAEQIKKAFEERLVPGVKQDKYALKRFMNTFEGVKLKKGSTLTFTAHGGSLTTKVDGKDLGTIASNELCSCLFEVYLGSNPVSKEAKDDFAVGMYTLLQDAKKAGKFT